MALMGAFLWFVAALWQASGKIAHKGLDTMDAIQRIDQRMSERPLPPPPPGSRVG